MHIFEINNIFQIIISMVGDEMSVERKSQDTTNILRCNHYIEFTATGESPKAMVVNRISEFLGYLTFPVCD